MPSGCTVTGVVGAGLESARRTMAPSAGPTTAVQPDQFRLPSGFLSGQWALIASTAKAMVAVATMAIDDHRPFRAELGFLALFGAMAGWVRSGMVAVSLVMAWAYWMRKRFILKKQMNRQGAKEKRRRFSAGWETHPVRVDLPSTLHPWRFCVLAVPQLRFSGS